MNLPFNKEEDIIDHDILAKCSRHTDKDIVSLCSEQIDLYFLKKLYFMTILRIFTSLSPSEVKEVTESINFNLSFEDFMNIISAVQNMASWQKWTCTPKKLKKLVEDLCPSSISM